MRPLLLALLGLPLLIAACQSGGATPATPQSDPTVLLPAYAFHSGGESLVARFQVQIDPATLAATVTPIPGRVAAAQPPQAISYDLDIANFLRPDSFEVIGLSHDVDGDVQVTFAHRHPFGAPNFANPISGQNRADLGYTGRLVVLADTSTAAYFGGEAQLDPTLVEDADGYVHTGDLLDQTGLQNNTFPFVLLADDGQNNRTGVSNGGSPTGSYNPGLGGWQRTNIAGGTGWTGYDYVHGGQEVINTFTLNQATITAASWEFGVAVLIKYTDPRGRGGRSLRFPPTTLDVSEFAYRLPFAALDNSQVNVAGTVVIEDQPGETAPLSFAVRDWDALATVGTDADLSDESDVSLIQPAAAGAALADVDAPFLAATPAIILPAGGAQTGEPGNELAYVGSLTNTLATALPGDYTALLRLIDPEDSDAAASDYHFGVDPDTITPDPTRALAIRTYQTVSVTVEAGLDPPEITQVSPSGTVGCAGGVANFSATATNSPTSWSWSFGGGGSPNVSTDPAPSITLGVANTYNGSVTATNAAGTSAPFPFSFTVSASNAWTTHYVDPDAGSQDKGWWAEGTLYDGKPVAVAMEQVPVATPTSFNIRFSIAGDSDPQSTAEWTTYTLTSMPAGGDFRGAYCDVAVFNNRLVVAFKDTVSDDLRIAIATVTAPAVPTVTDWAQHTVNGLGNAGNYPTVITHDNKLAIAHYADSPDGDLRISQATAALPSATAHWQTHAPVGAANVGIYASVISYDDGISGPRLACSYYNLNTPLRLQFCRALTLTPTQATDWQPHEVETINQTGLNTDLCQYQVGGQSRLALSYRGWFPANNGLKLALSNVSNPSSSSDWNRFNLQPSTAFAPFGTCILDLNGRLTIAFGHSDSPGSLGFARATVPNPTSAADFAITFPDTGNATGIWPSMIPLSDGRLGVVMREGSVLVADQAPGSLKYAVSTCPF